MSRGCGCLKQYLCHPLPEWMSFWSSSGVQVETRGCSTCTRPWTCDQGCFSLLRSLTKSEERQLTRERWQGITGWMIQRHWLTHKVSHLSPGYFPCSGMSETALLLYLWGMISVARPLAKPQQLPHGCLLCGMSPDAEKPAVSVYRKFICSEPQSQNSKTQREEDFQLGNVTKLWILIDFAAWNSTMDLRYPDDILRA